MNPSPFKVLITAGPTREPIDSIRFISNFSTGKTGAAIAEGFAARGHQVTFLHGIETAMPYLPMKLAQFKSFEDLNSLLKSTLSKERFDMVIHLVAAADFSVDRIRMGGRTFTPKNLAKMDSHQDVILKLKRNPKLIEKLRGYSKNKDFTLVGFKLTYGATPAQRKAAVEKLHKSSQTNYIVHNDLHDLEETGSNQFSIYHGLKLDQICPTRSDLCEALIRILNQEKPVARTHPISGEKPHDLSP